MIMITGNEPLDLFIMQSSQNRDKILDIMYQEDKSEWASFDDFLYHGCGFVKADLTDSDYNYIKNEWDLD